MFCKKIHLESRDGTFLNPIIYEILGKVDDQEFPNNNTASNLSINNDNNNDNALTLFVWPSALVLASYLVAYYSNNNIIKDNGILLEIGAGVGLPSIVAALLGFQKVIISDRENEPKIGEIIKKNIIHNNINNNCSIKSISWGNIEIIETLPIIDIILGSDVFYSSEDFDIVLFTISKIFEKNPNCIFLTTYQERRFII